MRSLYQTVSQFETQKRPHGKESMRAGSENHQAREIYNQPSMCVQHMRSSSPCTSIDFPCQNVFLEVFVIFRRKYISLLQCHISENIWFPVAYPEICNCCIGHHGFDAYITLLLHLSISCEETSRWQLARGSNLGVGLGLTQRRL